MQKIRKLFSGSGGAFHIAGLAASFDEAQKIYSFNQEAVGVGISSSLLVLAFAAIKGTDKMLDIANTIDLTKYASNPFDKNGSLKWWKAGGFFFGKFLVKQNITPAIRKYISEQEFKDYQKDVYAPVVWTTLFHSGWKKDKGTRKLIKVNLKQAKNYEHFIQILEAGVSAQTLVAPKPVLGKWYDEGGQIDHNAGHKFLYDFLPDIYISWYSSPQDWQLPVRDNCNAHQAMANSNEVNEWHKRYMDQREEAWIIDKIRREVNPNIKFIRAYMERLSHPYSTDKREIQLVKTSARQSMKKAIQDTL